MSAAQYTKWHKMMEAWQHLSKHRDEISESSKYSQDFYHREKRALNRIAKEVPFFVLPEIDNAKYGDFTDEYDRLVDAVGEIPTPFDEFVIEEDAVSGDLRWIMHYTKPLDGRWRCDVFTLTYDQSDRRICVPMVIGLNVDVMSGMGWGHDDIRSSDVYDTGVNSALDAFERLLVMLYTKGIEQEQHCGPKFKGIGKNKPSVPANVTVIKIGHYYAKDGSKHTFDARKPVRIHWRRGHTRRVWCGTGEGRHTEERYIPPCLVNYQPGDETPRQQVRVIE